jgi:hypothetical protein
MTSVINPNNINGDYPVAGVPNNTQGFRDNFTNIKSNFESAAGEITELQNTAVFKAALTGTTLDNNMNDNEIYAARIRDFSGTISQIAATSGSITVDYSEGHYQTISTTGSVSVAFSNLPASGTVGIIRLRITINNVAHTLTLPAAVSRGTQGVQGLASGVITFAVTGVYEFVFLTSDGGTTITLFDLNRPLNTWQSPLFVNSSEDLADAAAVSLTRAVSRFSTGAAETATLAAGTEGQIKTFAMQADSGDMVITVTNAGWKTSGTGTITFDTIGDACTLQYINSKWFCTGNNGCTFA